MKKTNPNQQYLFSQDHLAKMEKPDHIDPAILIASITSRRNSTRDKIISFIIKLQNMKDKKTGRTPNSPFKKGAVASEALNKILTRNGWSNLDDFLSGKEPKKDPIQDPSKKRAAKKKR